MGGNGDIIHAYDERNTNGGLIERRHAMDVATLSLDGPICCCL